MDKLDTVIKGIKACWSEHGYHRCFDCPYKPDRDNDDTCVERLGADALKLLKEKQPKKGHWIPFDSKGIGDESDYQCSECFAVFNYGWLYCPGCGSYMIETDGEQE